MSSTATTGRTVAGARLLGRVLDENGTPLAGAGIVLGLDDAVS